MLQNISIKTDVDTLNPLLEANVTAAVDVECILNVCRKSISQYGSAL